VRVLVVDTYYAGFVEAHYRRHPALARQPYEVQLRSLLDQSFGTGDAYSRALRAAGHEAVESIVDCAPLQARWAAEHGLGWLLRRMVAVGSGRLASRARARLLRRVALAQVEAYDPDVVYIQNTSFFARTDLDVLRRSGRFVAGQLASPAPPRELLAGFDLIVTSFPHFVDRFTAAGIPSAYLPLAFDDAVLERLRARGVSADPSGDRDHPVTFVGGVDPSVHGAGTALLERVATSEPVDVWGYGVDALAAGSPLRARHHGQAWGLDMYEVLARSRIVLNRHIDVAEDFANNMRLFEATGAGALLLTDAKRNLSDLYEPGSEVVTYRDADDLLAQIAELRGDEDRRASIAAGGQRRTLRDHTYGRRISELASLLQARMSRG
jgi:spore maturation protein CgeB